MMTLLVMMMDIIAWLMIRRSRGESMMTRQKSKKSPRLKTFQIFSAFVGG